MRTCRSTEGNSGKKVGPSGFRVGTVTPRQGSDTAEMGGYCGNRPRTCLDLTLYGHRQLVYHRRTATEDRTPVGTDPSAVAGPNGTGGIAAGFPGNIARFHHAGGPKR